MSKPNLLHVTRTFEGRIIDGVAVHKPEESYSFSWLCSISENGKELERRSTSNPWIELEDMIALALEL